MQAKVARTLASWHALIASRSAAGLDAMLAEEVCFHSPVVHTPQVGRAKTALYLRAALQVLGGPEFQYLRKIVDEHDAVLEFVTTVDGVIINGVDMIRFDADGLIIDFKVMLRPLKAINLVHEKMALQLRAMTP